MAQSVADDPRSVLLQLHVYADYGDIRKDVLRRQRNRRKACSCCMVCIFSAHWNTFISPFPFQKKIKYDTFYSEANFSLPGHDSETRKPPYSFCDRCYQSRLRAFDSCNMEGISREWLGVISAEALTDQPEARMPSQPIFHFPTSLPGYPHPRIFPGRVPLGTRPSILPGYTSPAAIQ